MHLTARTEARVNIDGQMDFNIDSCNMQYFSRHNENTVEENIIDSYW